MSDGSVLQVEDLSLAEARLHDSPFVLAAEEMAHEWAVEPRALVVRTLLHLPRVASREGRVSWEAVGNELRRRAEELRGDQAKVSALIPNARFKLQHLMFVEYGPWKAAEIFSHLHYLRNARPGARNYALVDPRRGLPVSLCSVSPLEWKKVSRQIVRQFDIAPAGIWDVSRVYSFDVSPPYAISYLLARVRRALRVDEPAAELLTTAVDPNLGFTGASYLAANWRRWMTIRARPYLYLDGSYISPRQLLGAYESANLASIQAEHGVEIEQSTMDLLDSSIFCCRLRGETEAVPEAQQRRLRR